MVAVEMLTASGGVVTLWLTSSFICLQDHREATSAVSWPRLPPFGPAEEEEARRMKAWKDPPSSSDPSESEIFFLF